MNKVLVTGATGKSGMYFLKEMQKSPLDHFKFDFIVRSTEKSNIVKEFVQNCNTYIGDLKDEQFLQTVFAGGVQHPSAYIWRNVFAAFGAHGG